VGRLKQIASRLGNAAEEAAYRVHEIPRAMGHRALRAVGDTMSENMGDLGYAAANKLGLIRGRYQWGRNKNKKGSSAFSSLSGGGGGADLAPLESAVVAGGDQVSKAVDALNEELRRLFYKKGSSGSKRRGAAEPGQRGSAEPDSRADSRFGHKRRAPRGAGAGRRSRIKPGDLPRGDVRKKRPVFERIRPGAAASAPKAGGVGVLGKIGGALGVLSAGVAGVQEYQDSGDAGRAGAVAGTSLVGGLAGAWAGAKVGATAGLLGGPAAWLTVPAGAISGGLVGGYLGATAGEHAGRFGYDQVTKKSPAASKVEKRFDGQLHFKFQKIEFKARKITFSGPPPTGMSGGGSESFFDRYRRNAAASIPGSIPENRSAGGMALDWVRRRLGLGGSGSPAVRSRGTEAERQRKTAQYDTAIQSATKEAARARAAGDDEGARRAGRRAMDLSREKEKVEKYTGSRNFSDVASRLRRDLMKDFNLTKEQASGAVGALSAETGGFKHMQELKPMGGRGGYGFAQWTASRRRAFEAWVAERGLDINSYEANYGFLKHELQTSHAKEIERLRGTKTAQEASATFAGSAAEGKGFLRPGIPHYGSSARWAERVMGLPEYKSSSNNPYDTALSTLRPGEGQGAALAGARGHRHKDDGPTSEGKWWAPASGRVGSQYGDPRNHGGHGGTDIRPTERGRSGEPAFAARPGTVTEIKHNGINTFVTIDHGGGYETRYGHIGPLKELQLGQKVKGGEVIGHQMPWPGRDSNAGPGMGAPHLHFEVYKNGVRQNPADHIPELGRRHERTDRMLEGGKPLGEPKEAKKPDGPVKKDIEPDIIVKPEDKPDLISDGIEKAFPKKSVGLEDASRARVAYTDRLGFASDAPPVWGAKVAGLIEPKMGEFKETSIPYTDDKENVAIHARALEKSGFSEKEVVNVLAQGQAETKFKLQRENMNYSPEGLYKTFRSKFRNLDEAKSVVSQGPEAIAEKVYGGRRSLGNIHPGDAFKFRGGGAIQLTGRAHYKAISDKLGLTGTKFDLVENPDLINHPFISAAAADVYYKGKKEKEGHRLDTVKGATLATGPVNMKHAVKEREALAKGIAPAVPEMKKLADRLEQEISTPEPLAKPPPPPPPPAPKKEKRSERKPADQDDREKDSRDMADSLKTSSSDKKREGEDEADEMSFARNQGVQNDEDG
jgi:predicted chitinase/murein DD-endopeptidase MepM/ murein hydrolase activator NlpD